MCSLLTVHCVVSRTALVTLPTAGHRSRTRPHCSAVLCCTVLYCAVLYTVLCPPHYTLPTLHTCHKCDMLVRRELYNSVVSLPITSSHHHAIQTRDPCAVPSSPLLPAVLWWCGRGSCPVQLPPSPAPAPATSPLPYTEETMYNPASRKFPYT